MDRLQLLLDEKWPLWDGMTTYERNEAINKRFGFTEGYNARIIKEKGQVFHVTVYGDRSVGLFGGQMKVTFEDNTLWEPEMIEAAKEALASFYDVSEKSVRTPEEQAIEDKVIEKYFSDNL